MARRKFWGWGCDGEGPDAEQASEDSGTSSDSSVHGRFLPGTKLANRGALIESLKAGLG